MADNNVLGVEVATATAGFFGAVASLSAIRPLTRLQAILALITGAVTSAYCTPLIVYYFGFDAEPVKSGLAFLVGLIALHLVPGCLTVAEMFRKNPLGFIRQFLGGKGK
jgi:hypothetical protein